MWLDAAGRARVARIWAGGAERRVSVVRLTVNEMPQLDWSTPPYPTPRGDDVEYELLLDREHGHLLGFVARADGAGYEGLVVTEITYGAEIDPALLAEP